MRKFKVLCRVDAYVDYTAIVPAQNAEDAACLAQEDPSAYQWEELGPVEFDASGYVTLDARGEEIENTRVGYFG